MMPARVHLTADRLHRSGVTLASRAAAVKEQLRGSGVVAVLRASTAEHFIPAARVLTDAGVHALEITLTADGALDALSAIRQEFGGHVVVGAGTVLTHAQAIDCIRHGAEFLVSPVVNEGVIRTGHASSIPVYPGALTPTEFETADRLGADLVKLFPANAMGPSYLKDLHGPMPHLDIMPTGGISLDSIATWLAAGAVTVGLGGPLMGDALNGGDLDALAYRAQKAVAAVRETRAGDQ
ncbi:bifunctional 4-hydroxy-2-oxoglutarate aldolase/2-dehydro-3-deoxy-phosphogluconate aldolase [Nocardioides astragali]|uniref:Bifunctional 4-hydroxy-2-oxoglutarate aldolase/2-dehydro-3-deoxy-phosphogluconate aldolase n=1 Tax=Nocardioides astragali TaxID=1776736 RepID=A0ABW2N873_9ACTN|nr:bifunctional 4-hydroxy-2-oxoglutarate aldolase/2-dehydro-3-deoxy-phosphogluconate aldolase [Nocardioides astragali]